MKLIKKGLNLLTYIAIMLAIFNYKDISYYVVSNFVYNKNATIEITNGEYSKDNNYEFVQITDDFVAKDYQHLLNIFYTILNSGNDSFSFYCDDNYDECSNTINEFLKGKNTDLAEINNYVHPYYTYKNIAFLTNNFGKVTITIEKQYTKDEIEYINKQIKEISSKTEKNQETNKDKILAFHNYIINNSEYDIKRAENMASDEYADSKTHTAYGLLTDKKALCGGYSDMMSIYVHTLGIDNIRISGSNHVWNLINIDGWKHLDATWDDPVTNSNEDILLYDYFLITTKELREADSVEHQFNEDVYVEAL